jgi:hypothetical protein
LSLNGSFDTSILLDRGTGVHFFYLPPTKSTKNLFLVFRCLPIGLFEGKG